MSGLKRCVKKLAIANQTIKYKNALKSKNLDYNAWIIQLENDQKEDFLIDKEDQKCLKNDFKNFVNERLENKNDENLAKLTQLCQHLQFNSVENGENCQTQYLVCSPELLPQVSDFVKESKNQLDCVILKIFEGNLSKFAFSEISKIFHNNKSLIMIYFDEDVQNQDGYREKPWFKPDWAPDDMLSYFYFGGMIVLNAKEFELLPYKESDDVYSYLYKLLLLEGAFKKHDGDDGFPASSRVIHVPKILYHTPVPSYELIRGLKQAEPIKERTSETTVSVIIPSKDHPDILFRCIDSLLEKTKLDPEHKIELIVVDNGSNEVNKETIASILKNYNAQYIYESCPFNFSYMCNLGASYAHGDYLLFLNDDMEIIEADWLEKMLEKASLPYAGA
ncbi:MAG: glycosyltransferase, partial [Lachnospiraceae bacterium]|nr:glycosyltransferase [Lachnospiraceae bacterium]